MERKVISVHGTAQWPFISPRSFHNNFQAGFAKLRKEGHNVIGYIDDTLIVVKTKNKTEIAVQQTKQLLEMLGFIIHPDKSVFQPTQNIKFWRFMID